MKKPNLYIIAGPNGAGKTTFARKFLPQYVKCLEFVNADFIAGGLSPGDRDMKLLLEGTSGTFVQSVPGSIGNQVSSIRKLALLNSDFELRSSEFKKFKTNLSMRNAEYRTLSK
jgi:hypothetical protein